MKTPAPNAVLKIRMIKASLHCLTFGLLGLLPLIGVPFALAALWSSISARRSEKNILNPAKPHRIMGLICALLGALIWGTADTFLIYHAYHAYINS